ncbi:dienelactone hydrolase family protein [Aspergillus brunneoviolaceus CBS 621.78]|uniref:Dienelactone hydrolase family protein n=1 Tax=Aspergillus brunneoviolaceus CBS 621.78 TaxID=1450534 RepID=A0ACD1FYM5_9EURO|nr:dienelactone hydrolase family protein [Aspergillus brunneoviolaceus CBS 621.78]RAH42075.1 dienelactone hydrolase family protein [Aspergillus brunneoviolaceus CBS 621.78]
MSTTTTPRIPPCCLRTPPRPWPTSPTGTTTTLTTPLKQHSVYTAGHNPTRAILVIHDLLGWTFPNLRLLADSYAHSANATVFLPDFFGGETLPAAPILAGRWAELDLQGFLARNARAIREPEVVAFAKHVRITLGFERVGVVGFCWGGWAAVRLGGFDGAGQQQYLVDCVSIGHPSLLTEEDIAAVQVPVQVLAPERDPVYTLQMKAFTIQNLQERGVEFEYRFFPGVEHGCFTRGDEGVPGEREALGRGREAVGCWMGGWL